MAMTNEEIKKKMEANSKAWHTANAETKKKLEAENQALGKQIGGTYNSASGTWSDSSGNSLYGSSKSGGTSSSKNTSGNSQYTPSGGYTIGSQKGQSVAQNMPIGSSYEASDGSVWTKQNDGTIKVDYKGQTTNNAYTPTDLSILLRQQMEAGVPYQDVQNTLNSRVDKALNTSGLEQYAYDDVYDMALKYILNAQGAENKENIQLKIQNWLNEYAQNNSTPTAPQSDPRIDRLLNEILNREDFSYDAMNDPLYKQYAQMYQREGDRAMRDTLAEVAAGAGGMNSYAITAALQAANYYNSQLGDKIPELYQLAYQMYLQDKDSMVQDLGILQDMDATQYSRYRNTMDDWRNDLQFAYGAYQDAVNQGNYQTEFDYNAMWDNKNFNNDNYRYEKEWNASQGQTDLENSRYNKANAQDEVWRYVSMGIMPGADLIARAGMSEADVRLAVEAVKSPSIGSANTTSPKTDSTSTKDDKNGYTGDNTENDFKLKNVTDLNIGPLSDTKVLELAEAGLVYVSDDGYVSWMPGVDETNYEQKLRETRIKLQALS